MTRQRALRLAIEWSQGHMCSLRDGEAAEYHSMFAAMLEESMPNEPLIQADLDAMDYDKLIEQLNAWNEQHLSVVCGGKHFACDYLCENEDCIVVRAATALSTLQAENKRLNKIVCSIPTTPDSGRTVSQYDKEMSMCAYLDDLEAENEKLRAELEYEKEHAGAYYEECGQWEAENEKLRETVDKYATAARAIALHLKPFCDESFPYDEMIADAARKASDELEQVKREQDAAIRDLRYLGDCVTCKYNKAPCPREDIGHKTCFQWRGQKED